METDVIDRRRARRRRTLEEHGIVTARVRPGHEVALINVSAGGAVIECMRGLGPGSLIELYLTDGARCASVRGRVLRCAVVKLQATAVFYRAAIGFDGELQWFADHNRMGHTRGLPEKRNRADRDVVLSQVAAMMNGH
jgi:hypothetical protein